MAASGTSYTEGSIFGHVSTLSITSAIGLFAIFAVDLVDVFFIAMLGQPELAAAVGFAGTALFFGAAICIGLSIATSTVVAQAMGAGQRAEATRLATHGLLFSLLLTTPLTLLALWFAEDLIALMGAEGQTLQLAVHYFRIVGASLPVMGLGMAGTSILRSVGEARLSMWATIIAGLVNAILDPILIFGFNLDLTGAATASVLSRFTVAGMALYYIINRHQLIQRPERSMLAHDARQLGGIAVPSLITNLAGPFGAAYATTQMARCRSVRSVWRCWTGSLTKRGCWKTAASHTDIDIQQSVCHAVCHTRCHCLVPAQECSGRHIRLAGRSRSFAAVLLYVHRHHLLAVWTATGSQPTVHSAAPSRLRNPQQPGS